MKVGLAQVNPRVGDVEKNFKQALRVVKDAKKQSIDLLVFPELSITGYPPKDLLRYDAFISDNETCLEKLAKHAVGLSVICGFVERNDKPFGAPFFNSAALLQNGVVESVYRKKLLPTYDVFDERRYFEPGVNESAIFKAAGGRVGICICEDAWNFPGYTERLYEQNPLEPLAAEKPDFVINISASPFSLHKPQKRLDTFRLAVELLGCPVLVCNQVGGNDELLFDGASFVLNSKGTLVDRAKSFEEDLLVVETDSLAEAKETSKSWMEDEQSLLSALSMGLKDYCGKSGLQKIVLGLSGGIDSSVAVVIAAKALGAANVTGISLPTRFTTSDSTSAAKELADNLKIEFSEFPIEKMFGHYEKALVSWMNEPLSGLTMENLQPRIRMAILMAYANQHGMLLINTSNKSEIATGYATLYGDAAGGLSVLGDLTKGQVYQLARYINKVDGPTIPVIAIDRPPTAELRSGQKDEDSLPPYDILDEMVRHVVENGCSGPDLVAQGFDEKWVRKFGWLHSISEYKRYQLPPSLRVSETSFGVGRRIPIASAKPFMLKD